MVKRHIRNDNTITVQRVDFIQKKIGKVHKTDEGFLQGRAAIAKTGIMTYVLKDGTQRRELVTEDTLFDKVSMDSLRLKPITNQHPPERLLDSKTVKQRKIGATGEIIERDGEFLTTSIVIMDSDAIVDIENGVQELSPGYIVELSLEKGSSDGQEYDAIQLNRKYNHLAACDCARGGHDLRLNFDSVEHIDGFEYDEDSINKNKQNGDSNKKEKNMPTIKINNIDYEAAQEVINEVARLKGVNVDTGTKVSTIQGKLDAAQAKLDTANANLDSSKDDLKKLQDSIPELVTKKVEEKVSLDTACRSLLSEEEITALDGKKSIDVKKALILKKYPNAKLDKQSPGYIDARFDGVMETLGDGSEDDGFDPTAINRQRQHAYKDEIGMGRSDNSVTDGDKAYTKMANDDSEAWKKPL